MYEQLTKYCTTTLSRTALNSVTTSSPPGGRGGHLIKQCYELLVQHIIYDSLGTSETYFRIGNSSVVAMWYVPHPRSAASSFCGSARRKMSQGDQPSEGLVAK